MNINRWSGKLLFAVGLTVALGAPNAGRAETPKAGVADMTTRSEAQTELFELVATSSKGELTIFLDRFASNEPVTGAKVEVESGSWKAPASEKADGSYRVKAPQFARPGSYPLVLTVVKGEEADLIETTLVVAEPAKLDAAANLQGWIRWAGAAAASLAALLGIVLLLKHRRRSTSGATPPQGKGQ